jgi:sulfoxide reductase catalytic subunit YedY
MLLRRARPGDSAAIRPSEITSESVYLNRRTLLQGALAAGLAGLGAAWPQRSHALTELKYSRNERYSINEKPNSYEDITTYNNFYEFGVDKDAPAANSGRFKPAPWTVSIAGEAETTGKFALEDILKPHALEERVYRSMVDGHSMDRRAARRSAQAFQADVEGEVRRFQDRAAAG